jgi:sec-independent protein translocase protein TatB
MDILGIGPIELAFIFLIALILLGPKEMQKAGRSIGRWLRDFVSSDTWRAFRDTSREIRNLPNRLMREANIEELDQVSKEMNEIKESVDLRKERFGTWGDPSTRKPQPPRSKQVPAEPSEPSIAPPSPAPAEPSEPSITPPAPAPEEKEPDKDA